MKTKFYLFALLTISVLLVSCSATKQVNKNSDKEIYVFDDVSVNDTLSKPAQNKNNVKDESKHTDENIEFTGNSSLKSNRYFVQLGAFTSEKRAKRFVKENKSLIDFNLIISYSDIVNYYVVQLPAFSTRERAEKVRDKLKNHDQFSDAFILTVTN